ncbi:MAG TPA: sterol desaturase family protein [Pyrinomonadaceae bacterium]|jgi:sterol desaturase/sphingolipid hydroxylase (fatty acid hydroxylase superfamily)
MRNRKVPAWISAPLAVGAFALLAWLERRRPLRRKVEPKLTRESRNLAVAAVSAVALQLTERPLADRLTALVERRRWGLLKLVRLPAWLEVALAVVLMDYTLYLWHVLTHRVPFLWRFHVAHHVDLDLDASTALRFHFAELVLSVPFRGAQILVIGVAPLSLSVWQNFLFLSIMFHHSNVRLPIEVERKLNRLIITPRMHGIHHSIVKEETNSNWSSGLTVWDWIHGTLRLNVPQGEITIGVPAYREPEEVELLKVLAMPFGEQPETWHLPGDGRPVRAPFPAAESRRLLA